MSKLTANQKIFADEYLIDRNATRAYKMAYPKVKSDDVAAAAAARLLRNVKLEVYIQERLEEAQERTEVTLDRVIKEYARIAFFDPRKMFDEDGRPVETINLDDDTAAAIAGLEVYEEYEGRGEDREFVGYTKKYKLANKLEALKALGEHLGLTSNKRISGELTVTNKSDADMSRLSDDDLRKLVDLYERVNDE